MQASAEQGDNDHLGKPPVQPGAPHHNQPRKRILDFLGQLNLNLWYGVEPNPGQEPVLSEFNSNPLSRSYGEAGEVVGTKKQFSTVEGRIP